MIDRAKTQAFHQRMRELPDDDKLRFAINWKIPHTLFNLASQMFPGEDLQSICWFTIHSSNDLGVWSHGGKVYVTSFGVPTATGRLNAKKDPPPHSFPKSR